MQPAKAKAPKPAARSEEFEVACHTREFGRAIQRKLLQQQLESCGSASSCAHGEDRSFDLPIATPQHDRAG